MNLRGLIGGLSGRGAPGRGSRAGRSYYFTSLTPVRKGSEHGLAAHLRGLPTGSASPFSLLDDVHVGRWLVLDDLKKMNLPGEPAHPTHLRSAYLLFTAAVTAPDDHSADALPGSLIREIAAKIPDDADAVWGHCVGYPGISPVDPFVAYLAKSQLDTLLFHVGYPNATVEQVRTAIAARDGLVGFVRTHQDETDPATLQQAYLEESRTWLP